MVQLNQSVADGLLEMESKKTRNTNFFNSSSLYVSNQKQNKGGSCLLLIDPQNDFVSGSLKVPNADKDCHHIAEFIRYNIEELQDIYVTLDTHMNYHIAHPMFWDPTPEPFTQITYKDVIPDSSGNAKFKPVDSTMTEWVKHYTRSLEKNPRLPGLEGFTLTIWPPHCLVGTEGHNVVPEIATALQDWEIANNKSVHYIIKGNNSKTEHYSAFRAEVIVKEDQNTNFNEKLYQDLEKHSKIFVAGEALSHCVNFTIRDLVERMGEQAKERVVLLKGGMSNVGGFDDMGDKFLKDMTDKKKGKGLRQVSILNGGVKALGYGLNHIDDIDRP